MVNEALAKVLCHNIRCLIQGHYELGVNATFWGKEDAAVASESSEMEVDSIYTCECV
jgi:hypothetical protein